MNLPLPEMKVVQNALPTHELPESHQPQELLNHSENTQLEETNIVSNEAHDKERRYEAYMLLAKQLGYEAPDMRLYHGETSVMRQFLLMYWHNPQFQLSQFLKLVSSFGLGAGALGNHVIAVIFLPIILQPIIMMVILNSISAILSVWCLFWCLVMPFFGLFHNFKSWFGYSSYKGKKLLEYNFIALLMVLFPLSTAYYLIARKYKMPESDIEQWINNINKDLKAIGISRLPKFKSLNHNLEHYQKNKWHIVDVKEFIQDYGMDNAEQIESYLNLIKDNAKMEQHNISANERKKLLMEKYPELFVNDDNEQMVYLDSDLFHQALLIDQPEMIALFEKRNINGLNTKEMANYRVAAQKVNDILKSLNDIYVGSPHLKTEATDIENILMSDASIYSLLNSVEHRYHAMGQTIIQN